MERIQSAIQKARAARERQQAGGAKQDEAVPRSAAPVAALAEAAAPQARPAEEISAAWMALPAYAPQPRQLEKSRVVSFEPGPKSTPFDVARTRLLKQMRANDWRRIAITSPGPGCGKTMTTLNLAFSLARQSEIRTLVIEADLRRPALAKALGLKAHHSFSTVLEGASQARDHMVRHGPNLAFGTNYLPAKNAAELLQSARVAEVLDEIEAEYAPDVMLFDMPPLQAGDDTLGFLDKVDAALLVAAAGSTTIEQVDLAEQELAAQTNVVGVVLNKCRYLDRDQDYGYGYY